MHYTPSRPILALGIGALASALTACGADDPQVEPDDAPEQSPSAEEEDEADPTVPADDEDDESPLTELSIVIETDPDAEELPEQREPAEWSLTCDPAGGDHPDPDAACAVLEDLDPEILEPVSEDQACTMIYGGPELASVSGRLDDSEISAEFSREDGCEMHRWDEMGAVLDP